ncbi:YqaE/Pmp3 family membrane protein [Legionella tunisiensis]
MNFSNFFPFIVFFTIRKPIQGLVCLLLQVTMIGWIPAALWAVYALSQYKTDKKLRTSNFQMKRNSSG